MALECGAPWRLQKRERAASLGSRPRALSSAVALRAFVCMHAVAQQVVSRALVLVDNSSTACRPSWRSRHERRLLPLGRARVSRVSRALSLVTSFGFTRHDQVPRVRVPVLPPLRLYARLTGSSTASAPRGPLPQFKVISPEQLGAALLATVREPQYKAAAVTLRDQRCTVSAAREGCSSVEAFEMMWMSRRHIWNEEADRQERGVMHAITPPCFARCLDGNR